MNCDDLAQELDDFIDARLPQATRQAVDEHLKNCLACQHKLTQAQSLQDKLRTLPVPPMSAGFAQRAIKNAVTQPTYHRRGFVAGFSSAVAASLILALIVGGLLPINQPAAPFSQPQVAEITLSVEQVQTVNLVFDSNVAVANAELSINLPTNVELAGYPGQHQLTWTTDLKQGRNVLSLPIKGLSQAQGELVAQINANGKIKSIHLPLQVKNAIPPQAGIVEIIAT